MFIKSEQFDSKKIAHGFFGRQGGVSEGIYASLNCGFGTDDRPENVKRNRSIVSEAIGFAGTRLLSLYQVHGSVCVTVEQGWDFAGRPQADAMVTDRPGLVLGILTADCTPVLLAGEKKDGGVVIGAAHAGWGGALKGVLENTVAAMQGLGVVPGSIRAAIGPAIGADSYEVTDGFQTAFLAQHSDNAEFFSPASRVGHMMFDLQGYVAARLGGAGVGNIHVCGVDTYENERAYFSYRRACHRGEADYGRQISVIAIGS